MDDDDPYGDEYTDEQITSMDAIAHKQEDAYLREELIKRDREVLRQALDLLRDVYERWVTGDEPDIDGIMGFLQSNHPDWAPDE